MVDKLIPSLKDIILALVQGGAEIFPVSSSGHLVLFGYVLGNPVTFERILYLHLGTFLSIMIYFRRQVWSILKGERGWRLPAYLAMSFGMTAGLGFFFRGLADELVAGQPDVVAVLLIANGLVLGIMSAFFLKGERSISDLKVHDYLIIGLVQSITALPGISRLGFTLGMGLFLGLSWFEALNLSFILSLPTIFFANLYTWVEQLWRSMEASANTVETAGLPLVQAATAQWPLSVAALGVSFVTAWIALNLLFRHFGRKLLAYLAVYCFASGLFFLFLIRLL
jgi:undecaprenyl-diphosphatase